MSKMVQSHQELLQHFKILKNKAKAKPVMLANFSDYTSGCTICELACKSMLGLKCHMTHRNESNLFVMRRNRQQSHLYIYIYVCVCVCVCV